MVRWSARPARAPPAWSMQKRLGAFCARRIIRSHAGCDAAHNGVAPVQGDVRYGMAVNAETKAGALGVPQPVVAS
jgi:hypothetical protein